MEILAANADLIEHAYATANSQRRCNVCCLSILIKTTPDLNLEATALRAAAFWSLLDFKGALTPYRLFMHVLPASFLDVVSVDLPV